MMEKDLFYFNSHGSNLKIKAMRPSVNMNFVAFLRVILHYEMGEQEIAFK